VPAARHATMITNNIAAYICPSTLGGRLSTTTAMTESTIKSTPTPATPTSTLKAVLARRRAISGGLRSGLVIQMMLEIEIKIQMQIIHTNSNRSFLGAPDSLSCSIIMKMKHIITEKSRHIHPPTNPKTLAAALLGRYHRARVPTRNPWRPASQE